MEAHLYEAHERLEADHWWFDARRQIIEDTLTRALGEGQGPAGGVSGQAPLAGAPPQRRLLDIGCGTGGMAPMLARFGALEGVEGSPDALERARRRFPGYTFHAGDLPDGLPQGQWDLITCFDVLEHLDQPVATVRQVAARLKRDGAFVCTVPALPLLWSRHDELNHHRRRYTEATLREHLEAGGLTVEWISYFNTWLFPAVLAARLLGKLRPGAGGGDESDLKPVAAPLNAALKGLFASERHVLRRARFPVGVSLIAIARPA